ncbi:sodium/glutamate symporter [Ruegeria pomeroyi]|nr:sodium/glutamate symporter [Ruegeria pomeroyi]MCE8534614.1 sodium/glutamate symporter [Ruegeria pomeroyi]
MSAETGAIEIHAFVALTLGIVVYFLGERLTHRFSILSAYSIPEPVSGGLLAALLAFGVVLLTGREIAFDLAARDVLLVYFFTTIGLNARVADLIRGGPVLALMLALTVGYMVVQTGVGMAGAALWGLPTQAGVMLGTASLIGGHGTAIAWGPVVENQYAVVGAAELGIASATIGLIMASLLGGPIARFLIEGRGLVQTSGDNADNHTASGAETVVATADDPITNSGLLRSVFWIHIAIMMGYSIFEALQASGVLLPAFVPCLISGILLSNTVPRLFPKLEWPAGRPSMALVAEFSLSVFLAMSLMSMQLWTLAGSAGVLFTTMVMQAVVAVLFIVFVVFPAMGRDYFAGVISAGFTGVTLGATPTAIANMTAVTQRYGPSPLAFLVLPLVSAFFVDLVNAVLIQYALGF